TTADKGGQVGVAVLGEEEVVRPGGTMERTLSMDSGAETFNPTCRKIERSRLVIVPALAEHDKFLALRSNLPGGFNKIGKENNIGIDDTKQLACAMLTRQRKHGIHHGRTTRAARNLADVLDAQ